MGKKKGGKKAQPAVSEVDKTFYELTITDLNRRLARLRTTNRELEEQNTHLQEDIKTTITDRGDVITFLKRMLEEKTEEVHTLQDQLSKNEKVREDSQKEFDIQVHDMGLDYKLMHETLTSEVKLLEGKLGALEEYRMQRTDLLKKFESQEKAIEDQEARHKKELYEIERKFIIGKDKLKREMEERLLQLSTDFQDATELRIAATTHRVIRENIAINNELEDMLSAYHKLHTTNVDMKARDKTLRQEAELHQEEKTIALQKVGVQKRIIERLTEEHHQMETKVDELKHVQDEITKRKEEIRVKNREIDTLNYKIRVLEQNLHCSNDAKSNIMAEKMKCEDEICNLEQMVYETLRMIKPTTTQKYSNDSEKAKGLETVLMGIISVLTKGLMFRSKQPSVETISSVTKMFLKGDLEFTPRVPKRRELLRTIRTIDSQTGRSLEEMQPIEFGKASDRKPTSLAQAQQKSAVAFAEEVEEMETASEVFYDEQIVEEEEEEIIPISTEKELEEAGQSLADMLLLGSASANLTKSSTVMAVQSSSKKRLESVKEEEEGTEKTEKKESETSESKESVKADKAEGEEIERQESEPVVKSEDDVGEEGEPEATE